MDDNLRIWRSFQIGKLFDLIMLDTRNYDRSITTLGWNDDYVAELKDDAGRSLMGSHQENWFYNQLSKSSNRGATWRIIGNQIVFSRINNTARNEDWLNADQWDVSQAIIGEPTMSKLTMGRATPPIAIGLCIISIPTASPTPFSLRATHTRTGSQILSGLTRRRMTKLLATAPLA